MTATSNPRNTHTLTEVSHVTIPCRDLRIAEEFYVGLLGARVIIRIDAALRRAMGWTDADIDAKSADHLGITFGDHGTRLDLFEYPAGIPSADAPHHPHIGLTAPPEAFHAWRRRLLDHGVKVAGPTRLGRPGQASIYFNDPFGNHLELVTDGFVPEIPVGPPDMRTLAYEWRMR